MKLDGLKVIDKHNCALQLEDLFQLPPQDGPEERGLNILHFNSASRHYRNNSSANDLVKTTLLIQDPPAEVLDSDCAALLFAVSLSRRLNAHDNGDGREGVYIELGFCAGRSLNFIAALGYDKDVYGFDSCEGLPIRWRPGFDKGTFRIRKNTKNETLAVSDFSQEDPFIPFIPLANTKLIIGQLEDTLPIFCPQVLDGQGRLELLHVDTDIYRSARNAFTILSPWIVPSRTVIILDEGYNYFSKENTESHDEWRKGEYKAVLELVELLENRDEKNYRIHYHAFNEQHQQLILTIEPF